MTEMKNQSIELTKGQRESYSALRNYRETTMNPVKRVFDIGLWSPGTGFVTIGDSDFRVKKTSNGSWELIESMFMGGLRY